MSAFPISIFRNPTFFNLAEVLPAKPVISVPLRTITLSEAETLETFEIGVGVKVGVGVAVIVGIGVRVKVGIFLKKFIEGILRFIFGIVKCENLYLEIVGNRK